MLVKTPLWDVTTETFTTLRHHKSLTSHGGVALLLTPLTLAAHNGLLTELVCVSFLPWLIIQNDMQPELFQTADYSMGFSHAKFCLTFQLCSSL